MQWVEQRGECLIRGAQTIVLWLTHSLCIAALVAFFSGIASSTEFDDKLNHEVLNESISIAVKDAPFSVFYDALFANTAFTVTVDESLSQFVSGNYTGTVREIFHQVGNTHSLTHDVDNHHIHVRKAITKSQMAAANSALVHRTPSAKQSDPIVERLFLLKHSRAADYSLDWATDTIIPGVATRLARLAETMNLEAHAVVGSHTSTDRKEAIAFRALSAMNAVVVRDRESRMPIYHDLVESMDSENAVHLPELIKPTAETAITQYEIQHTLMPELNWQQVR